MDLVLKLETTITQQTDESDIVDADKISIYQMRMGSVQWTIALVRFDIPYATNTLARFAHQPREAHMKRG